MKRHVLKIWPDYFDDVASGVKTYELRLNDRDYKVSDELFLREYNPSSTSYSGRTCLVKVVHMTTAAPPAGELLKTAACVLGVEVLK